MTWENISSIEDVRKIKEKSSEIPCLIFKHSTRCSISSVAKARMEEWQNDLVKSYFLDLLKLREVSNFIADYFQVHHESPQIILLYKGECIFDASHLDIRGSEIDEALAYAQN